jgi:hypothetical protein
MQGNIVQYVLYQYICTYQLPGQWAKCKYNAAQGIFFFIIWELAAYSVSLTQINFLDLGRFFTTLCPLSVQLYN